MKFKKVTYCILFATICLILTSTFCFADSSPTDEKNMTTFIAHNTESLKKADIKITFIRLGSNSKYSTILHYYNGFTADCWLTEGYYQIIDGELLLRDEEKIDSFSIDMPDFKVSGDASYVEFNAYINDSMHTLNNIPSSSEIINNGGDYSSGDVSEKIKINKEIDKKLASIDSDNENGEKNNQSNTSVNNDNNAKDNNHSINFIAIFIFALLVILSISIICLKIYINKKEVED